jgi:hypothetical protein
MHLEDQIMSYIDNRNSAVRAIDEREMEIFRRMYEADVKLAIPAALYYCNEHEFAPPTWLVRAALEFLCDLLKRERSTKRGRSGGTVARYHQDTIDFVRWNEVTVIRDKQAESHRTVTDWADMWAAHADTSAADRKYFQEYLDRDRWLGRSLKRAYECVAETLERTEAFGSPESVKRSYREVTQNLRKPREAVRYHILNMLFLRMVGIDGHLGYGHGAKIAPWRSSKPKAPGSPAVSRET